MIYIIYFQAPQEAARALINIRPSYQQPSQCGIPSCSYFWNPWNLIWCAAQMEFIGWDEIYVSQSLSSCLTVNQWGKKDVKVCKLVAMGTSVFALLQNTLYDQHFWYVYLLRHLSLSLFSLTELNTAQSVAKQMFSQSASLQRWPWKGKTDTHYF